MKEILPIMDLVFQLKRVPRTGWNKKFPKGSKYKSRKVRLSESVADHSFGAAVLALLIGEYEHFNKQKVLELLLVHDLMEAFTGDLVTTTLPEVKKQKAIQDKKKLEKSAAENIGKHGGYGKKIFKLWQEYDAGKTKEAKLANQFDKLEMDMQALFYARRGHTVDPVEFMDSNKDMMQNKTLQKVLSSMYKVAGRKQKATKSKK